MIPRNELRGIDLDEADAYVEDPALAREAAINRLVEEMHIRYAAEQRYLEQTSGTLGPELTLADFDEAGTIEYLVEDFLPTGACLGEIVAKRSKGKSTFAISLFGSVAMGVKWFKKATKRAHVFYVVGEGDEGFKRRVRAYCLRNNLDLGEFLKWFHIQPHALMKNPQILAEIKRRVAQYVEAGDEYVIVWDTWAKTSGVSNETDPAEVSRVLASLFHEFPNAQTWILHHPNESTQDSAAPKARGASSHMADTDYVITLFDENGYVSASTEEAHGGKAKDCQPTTLTGFYVEQFDNAVVLGKKEGVAKSKRRGFSSAVQNVIKILTYEPNSREQPLNKFRAQDFIEFAKSLDTGHGDSTLRKHLGEAVEANVLRAAGYPKVYSIGEAFPMEETQQFPDAFTAPPAVGADDANQANEIREDAQW